MGFVRSNHQPWRSDVRRPCVAGAPFCMTAVVPARNRVRTRTRVLLYGLLTFISLWILFGPSLAASSLEALGCSGNLSACGRQSNPLSAWLVPWLSARPPLETAFVLLNQSSPLLLVWTGLIVLSLRRDRSRSEPSEAPVAAPAFPPETHRPGRTTPPAGAPPTASNRSCLRWQQWPSRSVAAWSSALPRGCACGGSSHRSQAC